MYYRPLVHVDGEVTVQTLDWYVHGILGSPYGKRYIAEHGWLTLEQYEDWRDTRDLVAKATQEAGVNTDF